MEDEVCCRMLGGQMPGRSAQCSCHGPSLAAFFIEDRTEFWMYSETEC